MKIAYPKVLQESENIKIKEIAFNCGILTETARLLYDRGIKDVQSAKRFLSPDKSHFLNPFDLKGMSEAVSRIKKAEEFGERVLVFGDYDADGICAAAILGGCLKQLGINPIITVPEREEGYGLNLEKIEKINSENKIDLIITVDCGISDAEKVKELKARGIDVIITDHHEPPEILPDCVCINPKIKGQSYGFDGLCGGGVAYKLGVALIGEKADEFLDFAALATVADSMDLISENRDIVAEGLKLINTAPRQAFKIFLGDNTKTVSAQTLAYAIAPRVNAGGRMGDASTALKLFLSEDENEIFDLAVKLNVYNANRQDLCETTFINAKDIISETGAFADRIILVRGEEWKAGILGIVAAKLTEAYNKPVIVFAKSGEGYKGSARSVDGINIYDAIYAVKEYLIAFGGHSQAAGLSVSEENFEPLRRAINLYAEKAFIDADREREIAVDIVAEDEIPERLAEEIELLEPFGVGNRRPLFATTVDKTVMTPLKEDSPHYSFSTKAVEMLDFNGVNDVPILAYPVPKTLVFELNVSTFRNKRSIKGFMRNVVCDFESVADGLSLDRTEFERAYVKAVNFENRPVNQLFDGRGNTEKEKAQFAFCFEVFKELGFFTVKNGILIKNASVKKPLDDSLLYRKLGERQC
ncbi:MAG: single-stranded-DNA-specific exonuclease RecJ [Clostridia bacterium]|nr:single-stranded-DNA-specific exonuclease RecJ [Clostridia bacterium]